MDPADEMFQLCRFDLTPLEAVAYYLPRLLSGEALNGAERFIHRADIYGDLEPNDLAAAFPPAPKAERTGARFFFTLCKRQKGSRSRSARAAGAGTWTIQTTDDVVDHAGVKVGEVKHLSFKKGIKKDKTSTGWVMEEYHCLLPEAVVEDGEMVLCKIHLSLSAQKARRGSAACRSGSQLQEDQPDPMPVADQARQKSAAYYLQSNQEQEDQPAPMPVATTAKRPAPVAADHDPPCPKRARVAASSLPSLADGGDIDLLAGLVSAQDQEPAVEAAEEGNMTEDRLSCTVEELLGGAATDEEFFDFMAVEAEQQQVVDLPIVASDENFDSGFDFTAVEAEQQTVDFDLDLPVLDEDALSEIMLSLDEDDAPMSLPAVEAEQLRAVDLPVASDKDFDFEFPTAEELNAMLSNVGDWPLSFESDGDLLRFPGLLAAVL